MKETTLFINLNNLTFNIEKIRSLHLAKDKIIIAVIKSDAYGHGLIQAASALMKNSVNFFGIIKMEEAYLLQKNFGSPNLNNPKLLMLAGVFEEYIEDCLNMNLSISIYDKEYLKFINSYCKKFNKKANIHIKYDSGMNRLGFNKDELIKALDYIENNKAYLNIEGIFSHLSSAGADLEYTNFQLNSYKDILNILSLKGISPKYTHISASSAILNENIKEDFSNSIRPGVSLYGFNPNILYNNHETIDAKVLNNNDNKNKNDNKNSFQNNKAGLINLKPLMALKSSIISIKKIKKDSFVSYDKTFKAPNDMVIAVINAGYDNGIPRLLSNKGRVIIKDQYAKIIGRITMNMIMVDITQIHDISLDDEVIIVGQSATKNIGMEEIASIAQTIPYEICLNIGKSNKRLYIS
jgi:alanine racemase